MISENSSPNDLFYDDRRQTRPQFVSDACLPMTTAEVERRGWEEVDVIIVTGDAYVDSPNFSNGRIARILEKDGFSVAIISQPQWDSVHDFQIFGRPRLAFYVTAGDNDSMLNHYSSNRSRKTFDRYTAGGRADKRPDRATIQYSQRAKEAFPDVPVIVGGIEASLRRIAHYDYWSDRVRRSILLDSTADLLIYGPEERQLLEILRRLSQNESISSIRNVRGTVYRLKAGEDLLEESETLIHLPSFEETTGTDLLPPYSEEISRLSKEKKDIQHELDQDKRTHALDFETRSSYSRQIIGIEKKILRFRQENLHKSKLNFVKMTQLVYENLNPSCSKTLLQESGDVAVVVNPPAFPQSEKELDAIYALPFTRAPHPAYVEAIPAFEETEFDISLNGANLLDVGIVPQATHEGLFTRSRSVSSILEEIAALNDRAAQKQTRCTLCASYLNLYGIEPKDVATCEKCRRNSCLSPSPCDNLLESKNKILSLINHNQDNECNAQIRGNFFVGSHFISEFLIHETLKNSAHTDVSVDLGQIQGFGSDLTGTLPTEDFERFAQAWENARSELNKDESFSTQMTAGNPGSTLNSTVDLAVYLRKLNIQRKRVDDFIPSPLLLTTCAYYTGINPLTEDPLYVGRTLHERRLQSSLLQYENPANYFDIKNALKEAKHEELIGNSPTSLIPPYPPKSEALRQKSRVRFLQKRDTREKEAKEQRRNELISRSESERGAKGSTNRSNRYENGHSSEKPFKSSTPGRNFRRHNGNPRKPSFYDREGDTVSPNEKRPAGKFRPFSSFRQDRRDESPENAGFRNRFSRNPSQMGSSTEEAGGSFSRSSSFHKSNHFKSRGGSNDRRQGNNSSSKKQGSSDAKNFRKPFGNRDKRGFKRGEDF